MSDKNESKPDARSRTRCDEGNRPELRPMFNDIIAEGVPERFPEILHKLDDRNNKRKLDDARTPQAAGSGPHRGTATARLGEDDYAVFEETKIGRIYRQQIRGDMKWLRLQTVPAPPPNQGIADTLEEAKAALTARHEEIKPAGRWQVLIRAFRITDR